VLPGVAADVEIDTPAPGEGPDHLVGPLAAVDVFWDRVLSVRPAGSAEVFDAHVPGTHSFLANGVVSHNSGAIEQDADVVMFIYRDEIYNPESSDRGTAEVIVAKHRNGPVGSVQLSFIGNYARFVNMARI
jgi:replicative DNA helicase